MKNSVKNSALAVLLMAGGSLAMADGAFSGKLGLGGKAGDGEA